VVSGRHRHHRGGAGYSQQRRALKEAIVEGLERIIREHRFFAGLDEGFCQLVCGCAKNVRFEEGQYLFREGDPADWFYLIRHGRVALAVMMPGRGSITFQTVGVGEIAGVSWLVQPYRWTYDAKALEPTRAIAMDAGCLRGKCEQDHDLGYEVMKRFVPILVERLQATRLQILDVYGGAS
jgi:CRP/FNR family cyclic AMP-dependent transcriptional regulator